MGKSRKSRVLMIEKQDSLQSQHAAPQAAIPCFTLLDEYISTDVFSNVILLWSNLLCVMCAVFDDVNDNEFFIQSVNSKLLTVKRLQITHKISGGHELITYLNLSGEIFLIKFINKQATNSDDLFCVPYPALIRFKSYLSSLMDNSEQFSSDILTLLVAYLFEDNQVVPIH